MPVDSKLRILSRGRITLNSFPSDPDEHLSMHRLNGLLA